MNQLFVHSGMFFVHVCILLYNLFWSIKKGRPRLLFIGYYVCHSGNRREEMVITRLRLGHCLLNKTLKLIGSMILYCVRVVRKRSQ